MFDLDKPNLNIIRKKRNITVQMKNLLFLMTILLAFGPAVFAQKTPDFQTVKTAKGLMVIYRNQPQAFAFLVPQGYQNAEPDSENSLLIGTDSEVLSEGLLVYFVKKSKTLDKKKTSDDLETLSDYRAANLATLEKVF